MQIWEIRVQFPAEAGIFYMPNQPLLVLTQHHFPLRIFSGREAGCTYLMTRLMRE
jgi:hypothetical protein